MTDGTAPAKRGFGIFALLLTAFVGIGIGGFATSAFSHGGFGMRGMHGWGGGHHGRHMDPERAAEHAERMIERFGWAIDATPDQKTQLTAIAKGVIKDLAPMRQKFHEAHARAINLLRQPKTDRAALEALRVEQMTLADEASKRVVTALADAADVLTPQQRQKLAEHHRHQ